MVFLFINLENGFGTNLVFIPNFLWTVLKSFLTTARQIICNCYVLTLAFVLYAIFFNILLQTTWLCDVWLQNYGAINFVPFIGPPRVDFPVCFGLLQPSDRLKTEEEIAKEEKEELEALEVSANVIIHSKCWLHSVSCPLKFLQSVMASITYKMLFTNQPI